MASRFEDAIEATDRALRTSRPLRIWLGSLRWCGDSIHGTTRLTVKDRAVLTESGSEAIVFFLLLATDPDAGARPVFLPLSLARVRLDREAFALEADQSTIFIMEAERREGYARFVVDAFRRGEKIRTGSGDSLIFDGEDIGAFRAVSSIPGGDTSNLLLRIMTGSGDVVLKSYRFLDTGNREPEILARLHARKFPHVARHLGDVALGRGKDRLVLGTVTAHVDAVDLFTWLRDEWRRCLGREAGPNEDVAEASRGIASDLGGATAALHEALIDRHPRPWHTEPFTEEDFRDTFKSATRSLGSALRRLGQFARGDETTLAESARQARAHLLDLRAQIEETLRRLEASVGGVKCVIHSDLHLAQVLRRRSDGELLFIDFEGEPDRASGERGRKLPPLRDVGSLVRSFAYVRHYAIRDFLSLVSSGATAPSMKAHSEPAEGMLERLTAWEEDMVGRFTGAYLSRSALHHGLDSREARQLIRGWAMEKALYELEYELKHRVSNFPIPLDGIAALAAPAQR
ncbi:MAG: hypothetical protein E6K08_07605 [Methanobacteriota archaeon]|nr:MAG: hypothetical protein E6K08_07605 [Euryarchaeota archaeon]TLZ78839.1 MAG: hypothetical protein E6K11_08055 [Euryarchaeota archaeon]